MTALVSVVIPSFNASRFIAASIQSVLNQTHRALEVLVVDDGSTDDTCAVVEAVVRTDPRVRLIRLPTNSGRPAVARNYGIEHAKGEFVAFLDADDIWSRRKIADQVHAMTRNPDLVLVYSMLLNFGAVDLLTIDYGVKPLPARAALTHSSLEFENTIGCSSVLVRTRAVRSAGAFDEDPGLAAVEDYDLWLRLSEGGRIGFIPRIHGYYRVHPGGLSRREHMRERSAHLLRKRGIDRPRRPQPGRGWARQSLRAIVHTAAAAQAVCGDFVNRLIQPGTVIVRIAPDANRLPALSDS